MIPYFSMILYFIYIQYVQAYHLGLREVEYWCAFRLKANWKC